MRKIVKIGFLISDGSLWISFAYFQASEGVLACVTAPPGPGPTNLDLTHTGKVTGNRVKYSHHRSGEALFSQTGKIVSVVRKPSVPLGGADGHLGTVNIQDLAAFEIDTRTQRRIDSDAARGDQTITATSVAGEDTNAYKVVVRSYRKRRFQRQAGGPIGSLVRMRLHDGTTDPTALISPLPTIPGSSLIVGITICRIPPLSERGASLCFVGGFDPGATASDHARALSFLALTYPASDFDTLKRRIGTVDLT